MSPELSRILRHTNCNNLMQSDGFVPIQYVLTKMKWDLERLNRTVANDKKNRFTLKDNLIRANQGHSVNVPDLELHRMSQEDIESFITTHSIIHGTTHESWNEIQKTGLSPMGRNHVHFAQVENRVLNDATKFKAFCEYGIAGVRKNADVYLTVDMKQAATQCSFFISSNNVILSSAIPIMFLKKL